MKDEDLLKFFSKRLQMALDGRSHTTVGKRVGFSRAVISKYASGDIPESFVLLANLAKEYGIDLHILLTGESSPGTVDAIRRLKPYVLAHLDETASKLDTLKCQLINLLRLQAKGDSNQESIDNLSEQIGTLEQYHRKAKTALNDVLLPIGEGIEV